MSLSCASSPSIAVTRSCNACNGSTADAGVVAALASADFFLSFFFDTLGLLSSTGCAEQRRERLRCGLEHGNQQPVNGLRSVIFNDDRLWFQRWRNVSSDSVAAGLLGGRATCASLLRLAGQVGAGWSIAGTGMSAARNGPAGLAGATVSYRTEGVARLGIIDRDFLSRAAVAGEDGERSMHWR